MSRDISRNIIETVALTVDDSRNAMKVVLTMTNGAVFHLDAPPALAEAPALKQSRWDIASDGGSVAWPALAVTITAPQIADADQTQMPDLMIDIETLGTSPGSAILTIGAVTFDASTGAFGQEFSAAISVKSCEAAGLTVNLDTIIWWMGNTDTARKEAFGGSEPLLLALGRLALFVKQSAPQRVWAKPPSFDLVLLEAAYAAVKMAAPWHYRTPRCVRTITDAAGVEVKRSDRAHCALDDARDQADAVMESFQRLGMASATTTGPASAIAALQAVKLFHEEQLKAISKQPPSQYGNVWAKAQHQEQVDEITAALALYGIGERAQVPA